MNNYEFTYPKTLLWPREMFDLSWNILGSFCSLSVTSDCLAKNKYVCFVVTNRLNEYYFLKVCE